MPKQRASAVFVYRGYRLLWRRDTATWSICWTEREGDDGSGWQRTRRKTLDTTDRDQAEQILVDFANSRAVLSQEPAERITIKMLADRHYQNHLASLPSGDAGRLAGLRSSMRLTRASSSSGTSARRERSRRGGCFCRLRSAWPT